MVLPLVLKEASRAPAAVEEKLLWGVHGGPASLLRKALPDTGLIPERVTLSLRKTRPSCLPLSFIPLAPGDQDRTMLQILEIILVTGTKTM